MAKNNQLFRVLSDLKPDDNTRDLQISALEELMRAPLDQPNVFRTAVLKHQAVLTHQDHAHLYTDAAKDSEDFLAAADLLRLQQKAAEKRVLFGVKSLELSDVCDLLKADTREAKLTALEAKAAFFGDLKAGYHWKENPPILTDEALANIMAEAKKEMATQFAAKIQVANEAIKVITPLTANLTKPENTTTINPHLSQLRDISTLLQAQKDVLLNQMDCDEVIQRILTQNVQLSALIVDGATNAVSTINNKLAPLDITTVNLNEIEEKITSCIKDAKDAEELFATAKIAATRPDQLDEITGLNAEIQIKLATLKAQKQAKLIEETTTQLKAKMEALFTHTGAENERSKLLGDINALKRAVDDAQAVVVQIATANQALLQKYQQQATAFNAVTTAINTTTASADEAADISNTLITAPKEPAHYGNTFNLRSGGVLSQYFSRSVVPKGKAAPVPGVVDVNAVTTRVVPAAGAAPNLAPIYERKKLELGDTIHSTAVLPNEEPNTRPGQTVTCKLVKDVTGMVVDKSTGPLSRGQRILSALEHAELAIQDWTPRDGDAIVISGSAANSDQANRVLAALLLLKAGNPALSNMKIKSEVPGCEVPEGTPSMMWMGGESEETAIQNFIEKWIPTSEFSRDKQDQLKRQVARFTDFKKTNQERFFTLNQDLERGKPGTATSSNAAELKRLATEMRDLALKENEIVNVETGARSPVPGV